MFPTFILPYNQKSKTLIGMSDLLHTIYKFNVDVFATVDVVNFSYRDEKNSHRRGKKKLGVVCRLWCHKL